MVQKTVFRYKMQQLLASQGLTLVQFCKKVDIQYATANLWMNHGKQPSLKNFQKLQEATNNFFEYSDFTTEHKYE